MPVSSVDVVVEHLATRGEKVPVRPEDQEHLLRLAHRYEEVRDAGDEYEGVGLSLYLATLLGVSFPDPASAPAAAVKETEPALAAVGA